MDGMAMRYHEFGTDRPELLLVVQPRLVTWDLLLPDIRLLAQNYHVVVPVLPGHDFQDGGDFTSVERIAKDLEDWLIAHDEEEVLGAWGIDIGGSVVVRLLADARIRIRHAIIDAGVLPHRGSSVISKLEAAKDYLVFELAKHAPESHRITRHLRTEEEQGIVSGTLKRITNRSVWNLASSCHSYELPEGPFGHGTAVEYWCGAGELRRHRSDIRAISAAIPATKIVQLPQTRSIDLAVHHAPEYSSRLCSALAKATPAA